MFICPRHKSSNVRGSHDSLMYTRLAVNSLFYVNVPDRSAHMAHADDFAAFAVLANKFERKEGKVPTVHASASCNVRSGLQEVVIQRLVAIEVVEREL